MVGDMGLEPTRLVTPDPKSGASAIPPIPHGKRAEVLPLYFCITYSENIGRLFPFQEELIFSI